MAKKLKETDIHTNGLPLMVLSAALQQKTERQENDEKKVCILTQKLFFNLQRIERKPNKRFFKCNTNILYF